MDTPTLLEKLRNQEMSIRDKWFIAALASICGRDNIDPKTLAKIAGKSLRFAYMVLSGDRGMGKMTEDKILAYFGISYEEMLVLGRRLLSGTAGADFTTTKKHDDSHFREIVKAWGKLSEADKIALSNKAGEMVNAFFPHTEEAQQHGPSHSEERAFFIQQKAFAEYGMSGLNFETTHGKSDYLSGKINDAEWYNICLEETKRLRDLILELQKKEK